MEVIKPHIYEDKEGYLSAMKSYDLQKDYLEVKDHHGVTLRIYFIDDYILRFRYAVEGLFDEDFSYAIDPDYKAAGATISLKEEDKLLTVTTKAVICKIAKRNLSISIYDLTKRPSMDWEINLLISISKIEDLKTGEPMNMGITTILIHFIKVYRSTTDYKMA